MAEDTVGDTLRFVPGASRDGSELDAFGDTHLIRGFYANQTVNSIGVEQLNQARDSIAVERIEVLKGPASVLYGQLQPGAVINVITKQPALAWAGEGTVEYGRFDDWRATADLTGRLAAGGALRFRLTGAYDNSDSFLEHWNREHVFVSATLAYDIGADTTLTLETFYSWSHRRAFFNGNPAEGTVLPNPNGPLPRERQYTDPAFDGISRAVSDVNLRLEHRFSDSLAWRGVVAWTRRRNEGAELFGLLGWEDAAQRTLTRALMDGVSTQNSYSVYNDFNLTFATGPVRHEVVAGFDYRHARLDLTRDIGLIAGLDLYAPTFSRTVEPEILVPLDFLSDTTDRKSDAYGIFIQDRIAITDQLKLIGGLRYSKLDETLHRVTDAGDVEDFEQSPSKWTTQIGLVFNPVDQIALFANRSTSFNPTEGTRVTGEPIEPETGTQYEVGVKGRSLDGRLTATVALYRLARGNLSVGDVANPGFQISIGKQVAKGVELSLSAEPVDGWSLYAGYAYTKARTTEDTDPALVGARIRNVPKHGFVAQSQYEIRRGALTGLAFGGALTHVGKRTGDLQETFSLPSYWRADANVSYDVNERLRLGARVDNVLNERIFNHAFSLYEVWQASPRTWQVYARTRF